MPKMTTLAAKPLQSAEAWNAGQYAYLVGGKTVNVPAKLLTSRQIDEHARAISPDTRHNEDVQISLPADFVKASKIKVASAPKKPAAKKRAAAKKTSAR